MQRTSARGSRRRGGYVLAEAVAALAVLAIGGIGALSAANGLVRAIYRQTNETVRVLEERNALAVRELEDFLPR